jgi:hypothetical protein
VVLLETEKFSIPTVAAILRDFFCRMVPSTGMPDARACRYQAKRAFSNLL